MPTIKPLSNYNMEDLFLHCELTTRSELGGNDIDFTGSKTYNIGFMKEGLGFGITNINVDISPSMQPVIDITFKDFYGNLAIEFNRNKDFIRGVVDGGGIDEFDYSSIFELPYPKFKLTLKGYLGKPVALDLNVKRIDVSYVPNDGSYEIKAVFIPNLYGFFSDMPFFFLKAVNYLKNKNSNKKEITLFDIMETGLIVQQQQQIINSSVTDLKNKLTILYEGSESILDDDFKLFDTIENTDSNNVPIPGLEQLYINIGTYVSRKDKTNTGSVNNYKKTLRNSKNPRKYIEMIVASISTTKKTNDSDLIYLFDDLKKDFTSKKNEVKNLLKTYLDKIDEYIKSQFKSTNQELLKQITIETVFDLLVRDSSYLMGRILDAGLQAVSLTRKQDKNLVGLYYPLTIDSSTNEQIPFATSGPEFDFVNEFISALAKGLAEEERRELDKTSPPIPDNSESQLKKRINNLEIGTQNPYALTPTSDSFIKNLLIRTGLMSHLFFGNVEIDSSEVTESIDAEFSNINEGLQKLTNDEIEEIKIFCKNIKEEIDEKGKLKDENFTNQNGIVNREKFNKIFNNRLGANSQIDTNTLTATQLENNGLKYYYPYYGSNVIGDIYILFNSKNSKNNSTINTSIQSDDGDSTKMFNSEGFLFKKITKENSEELENYAKYKRLINFDKMQSESIDLKNSNLYKIFYTGITSNQIFNEQTDLDGKYFYAKYIDRDRYDINNKFIWNFAGDTDESILQRYLLLSLTKKISGQIINNEKDILNNQREISKRLQSNDFYKIIYNQFHNLCNNWKNLVDKEGVSNVTQYVINKYCNENNGAANILYDIPLLSIQGNKNNINIKDAIINIDSLRNSNEQSSVLNIMSNICVKNNFMFLVIPGLAESDGKNDQNKIINEKGTIDLFLPYTQVVKDISVFNQFYVLWMPTPENRARFNNQTPVYSEFDPSQIKSPNVFEVDYGSSNNTVFRSITMSTEDNKMTSESAIAINSIADPQNSKKFKSFDCSALSVMEGRSYRITVEMIGNAQIKPTQFFVLNSTHIFTGLYQIMKVSHSITPNNMITKFEAMKMKYSGKDFMFIPPITLQDISNAAITFEIQSDNIDNTNVSNTDSDGFSISESTMSTYVGTITHPSIPIANRALLDTVSYLDNGINTVKNKGYDVLVGSSPNNLRLIPDWFDDYEYGMNFKEWRIQVQSPTLGDVVWTSAAGRYQIVYTTWKNAIPQITTPLTGNIVNPKNPPFNKDNQDIVANFLLNSRLKSAGLNTSDIEKSYSNIKSFDTVLKSLQDEWESIKLLRRNQYKKTLQDAYDFFVYSYDVYKEK